jgi:hypothetical protein
MNYSITGFSYLTLSLALSYFIYRTFQYWKKEKDTISKLILYIALIFSLFAIIQAIGGLFFATNLTFLRFGFNSGVFLQAVAFALMSYLSVHIKLSPKISPWWGFVPVFILGMIATYLNILNPPTPFLEPSRAINWNMSAVPTLGDVLRLFLFFVAFLPAIFIFLEQFKLARDVYTKRKAAGFILIFLFGIISASFDFIFINALKIGAFWRDIALILASITFFIILALSQREEYFKK